MFRTLLLIGIILPYLEGVCDDKNILKFTENRVEYVELKRTICFDDLAIDIHAVYTDFGRTLDKEILNSIKCQDTSKLCINVPDWFDSIILKDSSEKHMMLINKEWKTDYKKGNYHIKGRYLPREVECFHVSDSLKNAEISGLKSLSSSYFMNEGENLHCIIFHNGTAEKKNILLESTDVTINYAQEYDATPYFVKSWEDCGELAPASIETQSGIVKSNLDGNKNCLDGKLHEIDYFRDIGRVEKMNNQCQKNVNGKKSTCYRVDNANFISGVFTSVNSDRKALIYNPNKISNPKVSTMEELINDNSQGHYYCVNAQLYDSKRYLLRGFYDKTKDVHCFMKNMFVIGSQITLNDSTTSKVLNFPGWHGDRKKRISSESVIEMPFGSQTVCVNRDFVIIVSGSRFYPHFNFLNPEHENTKIFWSDFPTKRCYYIHESIMYLGLINKERTRRINIVSHDRVIINSELQPDYLYMENYYRDHIIRIRKDMVENYDSFKSKKFFCEDTDDDSALITPLHIPYGPSSKEKIVFKNRAGCKKWTVSMIGVYANYDNVFTDNHDLNKVCTPFYRHNVTLKDPIFMNIFDHREKCAGHTCTDVVWSVYLYQASTQTDDVSTKIPPRGNLGYYHKLLYTSNVFLFKMYNEMLNRTIFLNITHDLPNVILDDYTRFYSSSYGKNVVVCFFKDKIDEYDESVFILKGQKHVCAVPETLSDDVAVKFQNFAKCPQEVKLLPNTEDPITDSIDRQICLFLTSNVDSHFVTANETFITECLALTCSNVTLIVKSEESVLRNVQPISDCSPPSSLESCNDDKSTIVLMKVTNDLIPNGKYILRDVATFGSLKDFYYSPVYNKKDLICFIKKEITNLKNIDDLSIIDKDPNMCVFTRDLNRDLNITLKINQFCTRQITFKATDNEVTQPSWEKNCQKFRIESTETSEASIAKLEDMLECMEKVCIGLEELITTDDQKINCKSENCYKYNKSDIKYIKTSLQPNNKKYYLLPKETYESLDDSSNVDSFYLSSYFNKEIVCIHKDVLIDHSKETTKGLASLNENKTCYFIKDLDTTHEIAVKLKNKFEKKVKLYKENRSNGRMKSHLDQEESCMKFVNKDQKTTSVINIAAKELIVCSKLTHFKVKFASQRPKNDQDLTTRMKKCPDDDDNLCHDYLEDFEYAEIQSLFDSNPIRVQNTHSRSPKIPDLYPYQSSYYSDEVLCLNRSLVVNKDQFNESNSYTLNESLCVIIGALSETKELQVKSGKECIRKINLVNDKNKSEITAEEDKCTLFMANPIKNIRQLTTEQLKECLEKTCSKVLRAAKVTEDQEAFTSYPIISCNDDEQKCLEDNEKYDFIEIVNDYVDGSMYFRTADSILSKPNEKDVEQSQTKIPGEKEKSKIPIYYNQSYSPDSLVCFQKSLVTNIDKLLKLDSVYIENNRLCALNNKLTEDVDIEYKINEMCHLDVKLRSSTRSSVDVEDSDLSMCSSFLPGGSLSSEISKLSREKLTKCLKKSCSSIRQIVYSPTNNISAPKIVQSCRTQEQMENCLKLLDSADAIEISTPFRNSSFYVSTKEKSDFKVPSSESKFYQNEYYADQTACFEKSMISTDTSQLKGPGIINIDDKICFVVKDLAQETSINVKQFKKCEKTITMKPELESKTSSLSIDECKAFYTQGEGIQTLTKDVLKKCLIETCSQLVSLVTDSENGSKLEKIMTLCSTEHGDGKCIKDDDEKYYFAKVVNPARSTPLYIKISDTPSNLDEEDSLRHFYKSQYNNDSVVCFKSSTIKTNLSSILKFELQSYIYIYICLIVNELSQDLQLKLEASGCERTILLIPSISTGQSASLKMDEDCVKFFTIPDDSTEKTTTVNIVSKEILQKCLAHTCSKVIGTIETPNASNVYYSSKYSSCDKQTADDQCFKIGKEYDYIKIENPYTKSPIYFRTKELTNVKTSENKKPEFYHSTYFNDDVVCFDNDQIEISEDQKNQKGIFDRSQQTCIVIKELASDMIVKNVITPSCHINITFSKSFLEKKQKADREIEGKCSKYLKSQFLEQKEQVVLNLPTSEILSCLRRSCSNITGIKSMAVEGQKDDIKACQQGINQIECLQNASPTDTLIISSPFLDSNVKIRKSDNDTDLYNSASVPLYYEKEYFADQVACFKESDLVNPTTVKALTGAKDMNGSVCIIIKNLGSETDITVKQFEKCEKTIKLKHDKLRNSQSGADEFDKCESFYSGSEKSHTNMSLSELKTCIQRTCSKIEYFVPKVSAETAPVIENKICESRAGVIDCLNNVNDILFARITNEAKDGFMTITTDAISSIDSFTYTNYYHNETILSDQVLCVEKTKLVDASLYDSTNSFETDSSKCIVASELDVNSKIKLTSTIQGCEREIQIFESSMTTIKEDTSCSNFVRLRSPDSSSVMTISTADFHKCLAKSCSKVVSAVELIPNKPLIQSTLIECESRHSCLHTDKMYDFIKIQNDYLTSPVYFRTFDPKTMSKSHVPVIPFLYKNSFHRSDVVCFTKDKSPLSNVATTTTFTSGIFVEDERTCVIMKDLSSEITVNYAVTDKCNHQISMKKNAKTAEFVDKSDTMKETCKIFFEESVSSDDMADMSKETLLKCLKYSCSDIESLVALSNSGEAYSKTTLKVCETKDETCIANITHFENLKITSPYKNNKFVIRSENQMSINAEVYKKTQYLDSYSDNDVVCIHQSQLIDPKTVKNLPSVFKNDDAYCLVSKDLSANTQVEILQYGKCKKTITFNPTGADEKSDECASFYRQKTDSTVSMTYDQILQCVNRTCSKVEYYNSNDDDDAGQSVSTTRPSKKINSCDQNHGITDCIKDNKMYQFITISNPSIDSPLIIKLESASTSVPIDNRANDQKNSKSGEYKYKSEYFEDDVVCVPTSSIKEVSEITNSNSYTVDAETCIIVKELKKEISINVTKSGCTQSIKLTPGSAKVDKSKANELYNFCSSFYQPRNNHIIPTSYLDLTKCLQYTCASVVSYHQEEKSETKSLVSEIKECNDSNSETTCISSDKDYSYIQVRSKFLADDIYLTTIEPLGERSIESELAYYYDSNYYHNDYVCIEKDKIKNETNFDTLKGFVVDEDNICVVAKKLESETKIEYTMTDSCSKVITFHNDRNPTKEVDEASSKCSDFLKSKELNGILPKYSKAEILDCIKRTCSSVISYVSTDGPTSDSVSKKIKTCESSESSNVCSDLNISYDILEIKSPMLEDSFYVQSDDLKSISKETSTNTNYRESYYKDDVVCVHKDVLHTKGSMIEKKVMYKNGDTTCFLVKESSDGDTFTVKIHGHCEKIIHLVSKKTSSEVSESPLRAECQKFYSTTKDHHKMNIQKLTECLKFTCSKVDFVVSNKPSGSNAVQLIEECKEDFGDTSCIYLQNPPYLVKVTNPVTNQSLYITNEEAGEIHADTLSKTFYKSEYNMNDMVCFKSSMLGSTHHSLAIPSSNNDVKCIVVKDTPSLEQITMTMKDGCEKKISLDPSSSTRRDNSLSPDVDVECRLLLTDSLKSSVQTLPIQKLTKCIEKTCSKIERLVEVEIDDLLTSSNIIKECDKHNGDSQCIDPKKVYDFISVTNSYLSKPLLFRTYTPRTDLETPKEFPRFYSSVYSENNNVCFDKSQVLNVDDLRSESIYKEESRICVLGSDVKSKTQIQLKIGNDRSRMITFVPESEFGNYENDKEKDKLCERLYLPGDNLIALSFDEIQTCINLTGSTIKNQTINTMFDECLVSENTKCKEDIQSLRISISSDYRRDSVLVISPETQSNLEKLGNDPSRYSLIYTKNDIPCIAATLEEYEDSNFIKYIDSQKQISCYEFINKDSEYVFEIINDGATKFKIHDEKAMNDSLQSAYMIDFDIYTFDSHDKIVSKGVSSSVPFTVLEDAVYSKEADFVSCTTPSKEQPAILKTNISSFIRGYYANIHKNNIFMHDLTITIKRKRTCVGYIEKSNDSDEEKETVNKITEASYECLPVLNEYLALIFNAQNNNVNASEKLESGCMNNNSLAALCVHTHEFTKHITICYGKGRDSEETDSSEADDESRYLEIRVFLKNEECYTVKAVFHQRVGFCEVKNGLVHVSLFSYDSFSRMLIRKQMINFTDESNLLIALFFASGLLISFLIIRYHKKNHENMGNYHLPLEMVSTMKQDMFRLS